MLFPFLVIVPGMIAIASTHAGGNIVLPTRPDGALNYDLAIPLMLRQGQHGATLVIGSANHSGILAMGTRRGGVLRYNYATAPDSIARRAAGNCRAGRVSCVGRIGVHDGRDSRDR
jgi:hypothetical protein